MASAFLRFKTKMHDLLKVHEGWLERTTKMCKLFAASVLILEHSIHAIKTRVLRCAIVLWTNSAVPYVCSTAWYHNDLLQKFDLSSPNLGSA